MNKLSNKYVDLYYNKCSNLAKTLVIKSSWAADKINKLIVLKYGPDVLDIADKTSWKYFMNICGEYHPTDTVMQVTSLDTLDVINFTKEDLVDNPATAAAYSYGTRYYYSLLNKYPDQEQLMLGILYPADMEQSIQAENGTILSYPKTFVESQEITLLSELESWIITYLARWNVQSFDLSDSLYSTAQHALLYLQIYSKIINLRAKRCKTFEAHSFHIKQYLASHFGLDKYIDYMTLKQTLFLYRNIRYIERNMGTKATFDWIVDNILSSVNIPLDEYKIKLLSEFDSDDLPTIDLVKNPLNKIVDSNTKSNFTYDEFKTKIINLAPLNPTYIQDNESEEKLTLSRSKSSVIGTKQLESSMLDYSNVSYYKLTDILYNHWGYLSAKGYYDVLITYTDPFTNQEISMFSSDAFIYMWYCIIKGFGIEQTNIPDFVFNRVRKLTLPTINQMLNLSTISFVDRNTAALKLLENQPIINRFTNIDQFYEFCRTIQKCSTTQWYLSGRTEDMFFRAQVVNMGNFLYQDARVATHETGNSFSNWLTTINVKDNNYTTSQYAELAALIFSTATGLSSHTKFSLSDIQKALFKVIENLTSYSVQFIVNANSSDIVLGSMAAVRTNINNVTLDNYVLIEPIPAVFDGRSVVNDSLVFTANVTDLMHIEDSDYDSNEKLDNSVSIKTNYGISSYINVPNYSLRIIAGYPEYDKNVSDMSNFIGMENFTSLTDQQKALIPDVYQQNIGQ